MAGAARLACTKITRAMQARAGPDLQKPPQVGRRRQQQRLRSPLPCLPRPPSPWRSDSGGPQKSWSPTRLLFSPVFLFQFVTCPAIMPPPDGGDPPGAESGRGCDNHDANMSSYDAQDEGAVAAGSGKRPRESEEGVLGQASARRPPALRLSSAGQACGGRPAAGAAQAASEGETALFLDACCGQLEELARLLMGARAHIASLQAENRRLKGERARADAGSRAPPPAAAPSHPRSPSRTAGDRKPAASASAGVIVLDSEEEDGEAEGCASHASSEEGRAEQHAGPARRGGDDAGPETMQGQGAGVAATAGEHANGEAVPAEDEELVFVSASGGLGGDLPHPRSLCPRNKFWAAPDSMENVPADKEAQNLRCCDNCYCYLCDRKGSECRRWSTGSGLSHCNAHSGIKICKELRAVFRHGLVVSPAIEDALRPVADNMKSATDGILKACPQTSAPCMPVRVRMCQHAHTGKRTHNPTLTHLHIQVHRAFEAYEKGHEAMAWDDKRSRTSLVREHQLQLGAALQPVAAALGVQLDAQLVAKTSAAQRNLDSEVQLGDVPALLYTIDALLSTVLSFTFRRAGVSDGHPSVQAAWDQYSRAVRSLTSLLTVALLIIAMHGSVLNAGAARPLGAAASQDEGSKTEWTTIKAAFATRLQQFEELIRSSPEKFSSGCCQMLVEGFAAPLAACSLGWSLSGLPVGEAGRAELRQASMKALLAAGTPADLESFVRKAENRDLLGVTLITGIVKRGLLDAACDAIFALAPESAASRSRSWLQASQFYEIWGRIWNENAAAGMRLALRAALGPSLPHRPDSDRMDPDFSARCTILKKAICELCKRRAPHNEAAEWQQAWARGVSALPESMERICDKARQLLDEARIGQHASPSLTPGQMHDKLRTVVLAHCPDGSVSSMHGRLLCVEVRLSPACCA